MKLSYLYDALYAMEGVRKAQLEKNPGDYNPEYDKAIETFRKYIEEVNAQETVFVQMAVENDYKRPKITDIG